MSSISSLIGERFEDILQERFSDMRFVGDERNRTPDFEHDLFYAEAKVTFDQSDYAIHLKSYQMDSFLGLDGQKPVLYLIGFHDYSNALQRLAQLDDDKRRSELKTMNVNRFYVVDNSTIMKIFNRRDYVCAKGHIRDCLLRESHLRQIILDETMRIGNPAVKARDHFGISDDGYYFGMPVLNRRIGISVGHIVPTNLDHVLDYFHG